MSTIKTSLNALARRLPALAALGVIALFSLLPSASRADTVDWAGITVTYSGAAVSYSGSDPASSDLILTYTDTANPGTLSLPEAWAARYLVVGGGGAGGTVKPADYLAKGQGGGGGGGGFLTGDTTLAAQTYSIFVGVGGTPAANQDAAVSGGDGGSSSITITSTSTAIANAIGGGGGGAQSVGRDGGSGGGGSPSATGTSGRKAGGSGVSGLGYNGGAGNNATFAAGGGGAGAKGKNTSSSASGAGGEGLQSDITGEMKYYAGGGGGGRGSGSQATSGGLGGGGAGGPGTNGASASPGEASTGGGGGGGRYCTGAAGGSGIVVIRLLMPAIAPTPKADQYFTGAELTGVDDPGSNWMLDHGDMVATNADTYTFWVKPVGTLKWKDSSGTELRQFTWKILPATVPEDQEPQATNLVYNGEEQCGVTPSSSGFYTLINARQTAAGNYTATAKLNNPSGYSNCTWHDGTTGDRTINFTIDQLTVKRPTAKTGLAYTGNPQNGINDSEHAKFYVLGGVTNAVNTGSYVATAAIGAAHQGSCVWETKPGDTTPVNDTIEIPWSIGGYVVAKPTAVTGLVYDGANKVGITPSVDASRYTIVGNTATNAGSYTAQATLNDPANCQWAGEALGVATIDISWSIARQPVPQISIPADSFVYDTNSHFVVVGPAGWSDYSRITVGVTNAVTVGEYSFTVALNDSNHCWDTSPATWSPTTIVWTITKAPVRQPTVVPGLVYNANIQYGVVDSEDASLYQLNGGYKGRVNAGSYFAEFRLLDSANYAWVGGSSANLSLDWSIAPAPNAITELKLPSWKAEEVPTVHRVTVKADWGEPKIDYSSAETGPWTENQPTNIGVYYVRATVAETTNWAAAERTAKFSIWSDPDRIFRDYVDLRVQGYRGSEPLTNFPLLVRISEKRFRGFYYSRAGLTGEDMVFMDTAADAQLPYEVDTWNVNGDKDSLVWVRVNVLTNGAPIRMYWALREGADAPGYSPEDVWSDYVGVWHFADQDGAPSSDATGNGNFGYPLTYNPGDTTSSMIHSTANIGLGRTISYTPNIKGGCRLVVSNTPSFHFDGKLTISGWLKMSQAPSGGADLTEGHVWPFSRRNGETAVDTDLGAFLIRSGVGNLNLRGMRLFGGGSSGGEASQIWPAQVTGGWSYFGAAYNGASAKVCGAQMENAAFVERTVNITPVADSGENLSFGNIPGTNNTYYSFAGMVDEYRLTKEVRSPGWLQAEFDTVNDKAFCTNSLVVKDGLKVNYWLDYPAFAPLAMEAGEYPTVCYNGRLAEGWASTNYVNVYDSSTNSVYPTVGGSYRVVFALDESYTGYELLEPEKGLFNLTLNGRSPYTDLAGNLGDTGRILLMNRHMVGSKNIVRYQGYSYNTKDRPVSVDNPSFWEVIQYSPANNDACPNLKEATESILWTKQHGARLWHLLNCRHGNTMGSAVRNTQNYFSFSPSSYSIDNREISPATAATAGQIVMRNIGAENSEDSATVYSSCFTNGIGTIYFDAVNGWNNNIGNNYGICVEICTNVLGDATALIPPTDENVLGVTIETNDVGGVEVVTTNYNYYANAVWRRVPFVAYKRDNTPAFVREEVPASGINLSVVNGGTTTNFYRMAVPLDIRIPVRFRIRRTSSVPIATTPLDGNALILLDNILVSYPAMSADLKPLGFYDPDRRGKQVLGQEIAFETPFPAQTDTGVFARAEPYFYVNPGTSADTNKFVVAANLHYRWRYLRQRAEPAAQIAQLDPSYVNYYNDFLWRTVPLNPRGGYRSIDPLVLPAAAGDVEFWYDLTMDTPYYEYVDYSGLDYGVPYDERHTAVTNHITAAEMEGGDELLPSTGLDWFVRLREGKSDFEGMRVVVEGELGGEYEMDPIEDNMWRALVKIPPDKVPSGTTVPVSFYFVGVNRQVRGATEFVENTVYFGPNSAETVVMPANGKLESYDSPSDVKKVSADVDSSTGYLELKISDRYLTWAASRAEYQNFNNWSDAHRLDKKFCVASGTNGVDDVKMKTYNLDMGEWDQFDPGSTNWNETFWLANYNDTGFPKEKFFQDHITPNDWNGHNLTFVSRDLNKYIAPTAGDTVSHMGAKLQGQGEGFLEFSLTDRPKGLGSVKVSSRIGQSISFDNMCYNTVSLYDIRFNGLSGIEYFYRTNYVFFAPVLMSSLVRGNAYTGYGENYNGVEGIMAVGASVSVVAYYWPGIGCYEFRLSRQSNNANNNGPRYVLELFRWSNENGKVAPTRLCTQQFDSSDSRIWYWETGTSTSPTSNSQYNPYFWGMFISVENTPSGTLVIGGISQNATLPISNAAAGIKPDWNAAVNRASGGGGLQNGFRGIAYRDNSASRLTYGGYGVNAKDCPVRFVGMHHYDSPVPQSNIRYTDNYTPPSANASKYFNSGTAGTQNPWLRFSESSPVPETDAIEDGRWASQSRLETFTFETSTAVKLTSATEGFKHAYCGVRMPGADSLRQEVVLMLQPAGGGEWQKYASATISGYGFKTSEFLIHTTGSWNSRITTGSDNVELVVSSVEQTCWEAPDHEDLLYGDDEFVYTQGIVSTNETAHQQELLLQPSRGEPKKAMSMRAPILHGLGKVSFSYTGVDANAEIWVQMATNDVESYITELNTTVKEGPEYWITIGKYAATYKPGIDGLLVTGSGKTGSITHYLGLHDRTDRPLRGLFRILVPTNVVAAAREAAYLSDNVNYGNITIRSMTVTDEPALSERCWRGWNLRTVGDSTDSESRMYLSDTTIPNETGSGLVGALNNTVAADTIDDDPERAMADYPTVYSPTFQVPKGRKSGIGSVDFRARLYSTSSATLPKGGKIWLYGSTSSVDGPWTLLGEYVVDSPVMKTFTWSTGKENYLAAKFAISDPSAKTVTPAYERIILDEITIREKVQPSVGFLYARPFRNYLFDPVEVADILSPSEQPLVGESWGVQTKVVLRQLADEIDLSKGFRVSLSYYDGDKWGYPQWRGEPDAVTGVDLVPVGDPTNLVFRSVGTSERTLVPPAEHGGVVQYQLAVRYYDRGGIPYDQILETYSDWTQPPWYYPVDKNVDAGGDTNPEFFSPYTILDAVSPGRAWINEINFNDGEPDINGGVRPEDNQFIELCIPSGIDMSGWKLRLTDMNPDSEPWVMAKLGDNGLPASKISHYATNSFEFYVLESPRTELAGGINRRDPALPEADGTWNRDGPRGTAQGGTLVNSYPYQLELVRPNGIVEHQIVFEGTNTVADRVYGYAYSATNLASVLSENEKPPSTKRMVICREVERAVADPDAFGSSGVVRGDVSGNPAPGDKETWDPGLRFTPGWLNEGQIIPAGWFLAPNGTNCWVYFVNSGAHIVQSVGTNTAPYMVVVVPRDTTTNVVYTIAKWYAMNLEENGVPVAEGLRGSITHPVTPTSTTYRVVASEIRNPLLDPLLADGFGQEGNPYADSIVNWLTKYWPGSDAEDFRAARFQGINNTSTNLPLSLTEMYWLDIPPVPESPLERESPDHGSNWWLRAGITKSPTMHMIYRTRGGREVCFTNHVVDMQMYITNTVTGIVHAPQRLRGLDDARSDNWSGAWTSETFKVRSKLDLAWLKEDDDFHPFRFFIFDAGSFTGPDGGESENVPAMGPIGPYSARIEVLDPHSTESIGANYGWQNYPNTKGFYLWSVDTDANLIGVETLKYDDTLPERLTTP